MRVIAGGFIGTGKSWGFYVRYGFSLLVKNFGRVEV